MKGSPFEVDVGGEFSKLKDSSLYRNTADGVANCKARCDADARCTQFILRYLHGLCKLYSGAPSSYNYYSTSYGRRYVKEVSASPPPPPPAMALDAYTKYGNNAISGYTLKGGSFPSNGKLYYSSINECAELCDTSSSCKGFVDIPSKAQCVFKSRFAPYSKSGKDAYQKPV